MNPAVPAANANDAAACDAFDAFLSYSTVPDYRVVQQTEAFLEGFHTNTSARKLALPPLTICVDGNDFSLAKARKDHAKPTVILDMLHDHLARSRFLIVFCSTGSMASEWVDKEVAWWLEKRSDDSIFLVVTEGINPSAKPEEIFSERVRSAGLHLRPWYDFRGFRGRVARQWVKVRDAESERVQLVAHLHNDTAGRIYPAWQRVRDHRERLYRRLRHAAVAGLLAWIVWFAWTYTDSYQILQIVSEPPLTHTLRDNALLEAAVRCGRVDQALQIALRETDQRFMRLHSIASELRAEGHTQAARSIYEQALRAPNNEFMRALPPEPKALTNAILLGLSKELVEPLQKAVAKDDVLGHLGQCAMDIAKGGMFERATEIVRSIPNDAFDFKRADTLIALSQIAPDRVAAKKLLDEAWEILKPSSPEPVKNDDSPPSPPGPFVQLKLLAPAYARLGEATLSLEVAKRIDYESPRSHLELAVIFALSHNWSLTKQAIRQGGPGFEDHDVIYSIRSVAGEGTIADALCYAEELIPSGPDRGRTLVLAALDLAEPIGDKPVNREAVRSLFSAGAELTASILADADLAILLARGHLALDEPAEAKKQLSKAAQLLINSEQWESLENVVNHFVRAKASDADLAWIESIQNKDHRSRVHLWLACERKFGADGKPLKAWLDAVGRPGDMGGPVEQWFETCISAGNVITAIEASKGIDNEGRQYAIMLSGVKKLLEANEPRKAMQLAMAIPLFAEAGYSIRWDEHRHLAIVEAAPALASAGETSQALAAVRSITAPHLKARALGATAAALGPILPDQTAPLLAEALQALKSVPVSDDRDRELFTMAEKLSARLDVSSASEVVEQLAKEQIRTKARLEIVRALAKLRRLRDARLEAEKIPDLGLRSDACLLILQSYAEARKRH